jgi:hypothetical protein
MPLILLKRYALLSVAFRHFARPKLIRSHSFTDSAISRQMTAFRLSLAATPLIAIEVATFHCFLLLRPRQMINSHADSREPAAAADEPPDYRDFRLS